MNLTEQQIENMLRAAPEPKASADLKQQLVAQIKLPDAQPVGATMTVSGGFNDWVTRWWPALAPAAISLACAGLITSQQMEIRDLKNNLQTLSKPPESADVSDSQARAVVQDANRAAADADELTRLNALVAQLTTEVKALEQLRSENNQMRSRSGANNGRTLSPEETSELQNARERAQAIQCVNNMKQMALAAKMWALDHKEFFPPDILSMSNELSTPKILVCPGDSSRQVAKDFSSYTDASCSYELLAPSAKDNASEQVLFRCPIHGSIALCDGSVQNGLAKRHPEQLIQREGYIYYVHENEAAPPHNR